MSKDFYSKIHSIIENVENENKAALEIKKSEFLKTELEPIKEKIIQNSQKFGKTMCVEYDPPSNILAKFSIADIQKILTEELEGFTIGWRYRDMVHKHFVIVYDVKSSGIIFHPKTT